MMKNSIANISDHVYEQHCKSSSSFVLELKEVINSAREWSGSAQREVGVEVQEWESPCGEDAPPLVSDCLWTGHLRTRNKEVGSEILNGFFVLMFYLIADCVAG